MWFQVWRQIKIEIVHQSSIRYYLIRNSNLVLIENKIEGI